MVSYWEHHRPSFVRFEECVAKEAGCSFELGLDLFQIRINFQNDPNFFVFSGIG